MERQKPELPNGDSTRTTFHCNTPSSSRRGISTCDRVDDESASLRVTKERNKKVADEGSTNSDLQLPIDLIVEILKRLPVKTLGKCLCVSKVWSSTIRSRDFRKLFFAESSDRPGRLFFTFRRNENDRYLFFSNQIPNPGEANSQMSHPVYVTTVNRSSSCLHDLICYESACRSQLVVYNSTTKRSFTLPTLEPPGSYKYKYFLCYDPIDAVYKVLSAGLVYRILTLGNGNEWRMLENTYDSLPCNIHICLDGVLYYDAIAGGGSWEVVVMSFDVRSENFVLIRRPASAAAIPRGCLLTMAKYEGKLAIIFRDIFASGSLVLWVLEDAAKHQWLLKIFVLPNSWTTLVQETPILLPPHKLHTFLNINVADEFILAPLSTCLPPFYVLYYDPKRNSVRKVSIEGIIEHELLQWNEETPWLLHHVFSSEVESLMFW